MLICGVEEPLQPSAWHPTREEETSVAVCDYPGDAELNRYTFVWTGAPTDAGAPLGRLLAALGQQSNVPATWVAAWVDHAAGIDFKIRSKVIASGRRRQGWEVYESQGLAVATKSAELLRTEGLDVQIFDQAFEGIMLVFGPSVPPEEFAQPPSRATVEYLARRRALCPSEQFLGWLTRQRLAVLYRRPDERGYQVLVLITSRRLPTTTFASEGLVDEVRAGAGAALLAPPPA